MQNQHTILVADDDLDLLNTLVKALQSNNFNVIGVNNGSDAVTNALHNKPDMIIVDEMMPGLTGIQVLEQLRKDEWGANVPAIMLTNVENTNEINNALKVGVSDYLVKSDLHIEQIISIIHNKLGVAS
jgi:DNA-binding response OmpR family regulator